MEKINRLYDYYKELLTEQQRNVFEAYYFHNFSLMEISEEKQVSRNAIHKQLKSIESKLLFFEEKLKLFKKSKIIEEITDKIKDQEIINLIKELE